MQAITIHTAGADDAQFIADMAHALAAYEGSNSTANALSIAAFLQNAGDVNGYALLAKDGEEPIGFVLYYSGYDLSSASEGFHLADIFVQEAYRRHRVGHTLMDALAKHAQATDKRWISLTALRTNEDAARFYKSLDFNPIDVDFYAIGQKGMDALREGLENDSSNQH